MKKIKIILGFISLLIVVFFATGLFVKETGYNVKVVIDKPIEEVFRVFNNPENMKNWIPEVKSFSVVTENPGKIGSVYKLMVDTNGQEISMTEKVLAYVKNEKVTLFFDAENMLKTNDYVFSKIENQTQITLKASCKSDVYIMACLFPFFKGVFKEQDQVYLNNFKIFIEK